MMESMRTELSNVAVLDYPDARMWLFMEMRCDGLYGVHKWLLREDGFYGEVLCG